MENSSRVPMPQAKLGAMPRLSCLAPKLSALHHGVRAEGRVFARDELKSPVNAVRVAGAVGVRGLRAGRSAGGLAHLVDHAAGQAEQHRGRAPEHFNAVVVEGVALQQRGVLHAVVKIACPGPAKPRRRTSSSPVSPVRKVTPAVVRSTSRKSSLVAVVHQHFFQ